jgi:hypothetical protein
MKLLCSARRQLAVEKCTDLCGADVQQLRQGFDAFGAALGLGLLEPTVAVQRNWTTDRGVGTVALLATLNVELVIENPPPENDLFTGQVRVHLVERALGRYTGVDTLTSEILNKTARSSKSVSHQSRLDEVFADNQRSDDDAAAELSEEVLVGVSDLLDETMGSQALD